MKFLIATLSFLLLGSVSVTAQTNATHNVIYASDQTAWTLGPDGWYHTFANGEYGTWAPGYTASWVIAPNPATTAQQVQTVSTIRNQIWDTITGCQTSLIKLTSGTIQSGSSCSAYGDQIQDEAGPYISLGQADESTAVEVMSLDHLEARLNLCEKTEAAFTQTLTAMRDSGCDPYAQTDYQPSSSGDSSNNNNSSNSNGTNYYPTGGGGFSGNGTTYYPIGGGGFSGGGVTYYPSGGGNFSGSDGSSITSIGGGAYKSSNGTTCYPIGGGAYNCR